MTVLSLCLLHDRRLASNIQHNFTFLHTNIIKTKRDLNMIGKTVYMRFIE